MNIETGTEISKPRAGGMTDGLKNVKQDTAASAAELKAFVQKMRGKSPKEVMGEVAESSLVQGLFVSTISFAVVVTAFTLGPFFLFESSEPKQASAKEPQASSDSGKTDPVENQAQPDQGEQNPTNQVATQNPEVPSGSDVKQATKNLGIDQTKTADPNSNPLENNLDSLLDGLE